MQPTGSSDGSCLSQDSLRVHLEAEGTQRDKGDSMEKLSSLLTAYRRLKWTCNLQDLDHTCLLQKGLCGRLEAEGTNYRRLEVYRLWMPPSRFKWMSKGEEILWLPGGPADCVWLLQDCLHGHLKAEGTLWQP